MRPGDKRPAVPEWEQRACADPDLVGRYWRDGANVGIACGPSGLVVIDLDPPDGIRRLYELRAGRELPDTYTVRTARRGGSHLYFRAPPGRVIRNSAGRLAPHVDVRGGGGYVIGAGSVIGGRRYEVTANAGIAPLPGWLAELAAAPLPPTPGPDLRPGPIHGTAYAAAALRAEIAELLAARPGTRNAQLNRSAFSLYQLVAGGALDDREVHARLRQAAGAIGLTADDGERSVEATIASGRRAARAVPRGGG